MEKELEQIQIKMCFNNIDEEKSREVEFVVRNLMEEKSIDKLKELIYKGVDRAFETVSDIWEGRW